MKVKINWGTGIVIALVVMISGMIYLVSIAVRQDYDLVDNDYYQKSVNYQQHIEEVKNTEALAEKIKFEQSTDTLKITFPNLGNATQGVARALRIYADHLSYKSSSAGGMCQ